MADDIALPGTGSLVETQQQADGSHRQVVTLGDVAARLDTFLDLLGLLGTAFEPATGRLRTVIDPTGGAQTLGTITTVTGVTTVPTVTTVTTVSTVSNQTQLGGFQADGMTRDTMQTAWGSSLRGRIT